MKLNDIKRRLAQGRRWFYCGAWHNRDKVRVVAVGPVWCCVQRDGHTKTIWVGTKRLAGVVEPYFEPRGEQ